MAVLGSSASRADDPPIPPSLEVDIAGQKTAKTESLKPENNFENAVVGEVAFFGHFVIIDPMWESEASQVGDSFQILNCDS